MLYLNIQLCENMLGQPETHLLKRILISQDNISLNRNYQTKHDKKKKKVFKWSVSSGIYSVVHLSLFRIFHLNSAEVYENSILCHCVSFHTEMKQKKLCPCESWQDAEAVFPSLLPWARLCSASLLFGTILFFFFYLFCEGSIFPTVSENH